jgi:putative endonuclease
VAGHQLLGKQGEALAVQWLVERGYTILHQNWRYSYYEIDIIASKANMLHFIEVKTRRNKKFGWPEESVGEKKLLNMMNAADEYQYRNPGWKRIQYDVMSIIISGNKTDYYFIEDVYL